MRRPSGLIARFALATVLVAALAGCGTSVTVSGTYADVWSATNTVIENAVRDRGPEQEGPLAYSGSGTIEAVGRGPLGRGELYYWVTVEPVAQAGRPDEPGDRKVTVLVRQLDEAPDEDGGTSDEPSVAARRRGDIERAIASEIERRLQAEHESMRAQPW